MRCSFLGLPQGAITLARAGHDLRVVGLSRRPTSPELDDLRRQLPRSCPLLLRPRLQAPQLRDLFTTAGTPLLVCYLWDRLLPPVLIDAFPTGVLNYHPSLLPRHRGADPYFWTLWSGDTHAGASIMLLDDGVDTGPILAQTAIELPHHIDNGALADRLDPLGLELLLEVLDRWDRQGQPPARIQDHRLATEAPSPGDELLELDWCWPADHLARLIRAASPDPGASTWLPGSDQLVIVLAAHPITLPTPGALEPGDALWLDQGVTVWTGDGGLVLDAVAVEGEPPRRDAPEIAELFPGLADLRRSG